jgi:hypothetical protein
MIRLVSEPSACIDSMPLKQYMATTKLLERQSVGTTERWAPNQGKKSIGRVLKLVVSRKLPCVPAIEAGALKQGRVLVGAECEETSSCSLVGARLFAGQLRILKRVVT